MQAIRTIVGVDTAKRVFQLHWVDLETGEMVDLRLSRAKLLEHFVNRAACVVGMEACGGAAAAGAGPRGPTGAGEDGAAVRQRQQGRCAGRAGDLDGGPTARRQDDRGQERRAAGGGGAASNAAATGEVPHGTDQRPAGSVGRVRRGDAAGRAGMQRDMPAVLERLSEQLPAMVVETQREQWGRVAALVDEVGVIEQRLEACHRNSPASQRVAAIPGVGLLGTTALVAMMGDPAAFRSGREFAAWLGLVPRHSGTGGRVRMLASSSGGTRICEPC